MIQEMTLRRWEIGLFARLSSDGFDIRIIWDGISGYWNRHSDIEHE